ncbi:hypothetical protein V6667_03680 [Neisseria leonii]|uniref:Uncharacterized protein n=1 Tax=Neisseria leonii TaxID=2995413 RepID=A0A9X4E321_9NEIS|nr:hypothetical protein [Neisseria sp. 51.81]MDD9327046.1 hypothetical protein [Neisseria sp. 51.81]
MSRLSRKEQRELLELEVMRNRLQLALDKVKQDEFRRDHADNLAVARMSGLIGSGIKGNLLWRLIMLPSAWRHRIVLGALVLLWQMWRKQTPRRR